MGVALCSLRRLGRCEARWDAQHDAGRRTRPLRPLLDRIYSGILHAQDYELAYLASANTARAIARRAPTLGDLTMQDREQLLNVTAQTEGQIVSTRTLLLLTSIPMKTCLDRVDGTK